MSEDKNKHVCRSSYATRPILYNDTNQGRQWMRDDLWAVTTAELNGIADVLEAGGRFDQLRSKYNDMVAALAEKEKEAQAERKAAESGWNSLHQDWVSSMEISKKYEDRYFSEKKLSDMRLEDIKEMQLELDAQSRLLAEKDAVIERAREALRRCSDSEIPNDCGLCAEALASLTAPHAAPEKPND